MIGYTIKSSNLQRVWGTLTIEEREFHRNIYLNQEKIQLKKSNEYGLHLKQLTSKTAFIECYEFLKTKSEKLTFLSIKTLFYDMLYSRKYDLINLTKYAKTQIQVQLEIFMHSENEKELLENEKNRYITQIIERQDDERIYKYELIKTLFERQKSGAQMDHNGNPAPNGTIQGPFALIEEIDRIIHLND